MSFSNDTHLGIYGDIEPSYESIKKFSQKDADSFMDFATWTQECMDLFLAPATYVNRMPGLLQVAKLEVSEITRRDDAMTGLSPQQIVDDLFESKQP